MSMHLALKHSELLRLSLVLACTILAGLTLHPQGARAEDAQASCPSALQLADLNDAKAGMVLIPGGVFVMGSDLHQPEERHTHLVRVDPFWMSAHEVTNAEFAAFVQATGYITEAERPESRGAAVFVAPSEVNGMNDITQWWQFKKEANWRAPQGGGSSIAGKENHPVVNVTFGDAQAYARWRGHTLPTEAEWEYAARGGQLEAADAIEGYEHGRPVANTWQGIFPVLNTAEDGFVGTSPAGCFKPNAYGLYDMIGNVWEWTADWYRRGYERQAVDNPGGPSAPVLFDASRAASKVIKGGSFLCASNYCARYRTSARQPQEADLGTSHIGFRTVLRAPGPDTRQEQAAVPR